MWLTKEERQELAVERQTPRIRSTEVSGGSKFLRIQIEKGTGRQCPLDSWLCWSFTGVHGSSLGNVSKKDKLTCFWEEDLSPRMPWR